MGNSNQKPKQIQKQEQQKDQQEQEENNTSSSSSSSSFTCQICIEPILETQKFTNKDNCTTHPFCLDCIAKYIQIKLQDKTPNIACPGLNCEKQLDPQSCKDIISSTLFQKWCELLCDGLISWGDSCFCPNQDCKELVVNECGGVVKEAKCPNCKEMFCFDCKIKWVDGHKCNHEQNLRERNEYLFKELMAKKKWVKCPGCGHCVERLQGCFRVKCRCLTRFCYNCGKKLSNGFRPCDCNPPVEGNNGPDLSPTHYICLFVLGILMCGLLLFLQRHDVGI